MTRNRNHRPESDQDHDTTPNTKEVGMNKREPYRQLPPFPSRLRWTILEVEINIPLVDAIKQVPHYAQFLKKHCNAKHTLKRNTKVSVEENKFVFFFQKKLPAKCKELAVSLFLVKLEIVALIESCVLQELPLVGCLGLFRKN